MPYRTADGVLHPGRRSLPLIPRLVERSEILGPDECWVWTGATFPDGYGSISLNGRDVGVHRAAFAALVGPIPEGKHVLHSCDNPPCWNPRHLRAGTEADNMQDQIDRVRHANLKKDRCPAGHPYDAANTYWRKDGARSCIACTREATRRWRAAHPTPPKPPRERCANGHPWAANVYLDSAGYQRCGECMRLKKIRDNEKARERRAAARI